jgi:hypothetical protein
MKPDAMRRHDEHCWSGSGFLVLSFGLEGQP